MDFKCYHCQLRTESFQQCILHSTKQHPDQTLKIQRLQLHPESGKLGFRTLNFNIIPSSVHYIGKHINAVERNGELAIKLIENDKTEDLFNEMGSTEMEEEMANLSIENTNTPSKSPMLKKFRTSTPATGNVQIPYDAGVTLAIRVPSNATEEDVATLQELADQLPEVLKCMKDNGHLNTWVSFQRLVSARKFPMENIAFLLFLDVCRFYALPNTVSMRYSPVVKRFWRIGYRLFHGKWIHFMGGPKNQGQQQTTVAQDLHQYHPEDARINFSVPRRSVLLASDNAIPCSEIKPGVLHHLLDKVAEHSSPCKTYKICVDGKKINSSLSGQEGDIDLFGFEGSPTLAERRDRLANEKYEFELLSETIQAQIIGGKKIFRNLSETTRDELVELLLHSLYVLGCRLKEVRQSKVHKDLTCEKLKKQAGADWRKSRLVYVISGLETALFDISNCISSLLKTIDEIGFAVASLRDAAHLYVRDRNVRLQDQGNYVHLINSSRAIPDEIGGSTNLRFVKQHSEEWFQARSLAKITGSTLHKAIGLSTLKQQQEHFDTVVYKKTPSEFTAREKELMKYGSENEVNAIATLVGKILPVFWPTLNYFEEGCYKISVGDSKVPMVVSPDGSCRHKENDDATFGIECKCPYPGKVFTTPVYYTCPKYYVTQILAEMHALHANELLFICYSPESTTLFKAQFCSDLWNLVENEIEGVYGREHASRPSKKSPASVEITSKIDSFLQENVTFLAEVPSIKAVDCVKQQNSDSSDKESYFCYHSAKSDGQHIHTLKSLLGTIHGATTILDKAYQLSRMRASEFLGFMISDLDRHYNQEEYHAVPIAYGLKGYSLTTDVLRNMIEYVLSECAARGLYIPICSFDGQWFKMAVRDRDNQPLTILQLQKETYSKVRKMSKGNLMKTISGMNVVKASNITELAAFVDLSYNKNRIVVGGIREGERLQIHRHIVEMIQSNRKTSEKEQQKSTNENSAADSVLSMLPENVINTLQEEVLDTVALAASNSLIHEDNDISPGDIFPEIDDERHMVHDSIAQCVQMAEKDKEDTDTIAGTNAFDGQTDYEQPCRTCGILSNGDLTRMLEALTSSKFNKNHKWDITLEVYCSRLKTAKDINRFFTKEEIKTTIQPVIGKIKSQGLKCNLSSNKPVLVNLLSRIVGDGSEVNALKRRKMCNPSRLVCIAKRSVQQIPKDILNCIYSEHVFPSVVKNWFNSSPFGASMKIAGVESPKHNQWYSRPEFNQAIGNYLFTVLDAYHQLCGLRRVVCGPGMSLAGISCKPFHLIAEESESNGCGLNLALVRDMIDKQSVAYAIQTFSLKVETALAAKGCTNESTLCRLVRNWYEAEDEPGISALDRCLARLQFREWLLDGVNFGKFPPSTAYVKDIPIVLYEGLLTGIERRMQLYPFTKSGSYNVRSIGSLDIENFFGSFQDIDRHGSGVLRPDEIPSAIGVAVELFDSRLDPERGFYMQTSAPKVYPCRPHQKEGSIDEADMDIGATSNSVWRDLSVITLRNHKFDIDDGKKANRKRKSGKVSKPEEPARGAMPIREFHRACEAKILPHVRRGLVLND